MIIQPLRVDWVYNKPEEAQAIGSFSPSLNLFHRLMNSWFEVAPNALRLAFGGVLLIPVDTKADGYRLLSTLLPSVIIDAEGSSDFSYQINRARISKAGIEGLRINRLSRWSTALWSGSTVLIQGDRVTTTPSERRYASRLEIDINTAADFQGEFRAEQVGTVFSELVELGREIAQEGDIP
jgi:hypothetical protein